MSKITLSFMERFINNLDTAIKTYVGNKVDEKQNKATVLSQTLEAGDTSVVFLDIPTTGTNFIDVYTSKEGLDYTSIDGSTSGQLTITYEAQASDITVYLKIEGYEE